jgi:hypothetical protein
VAPRLVNVGGLLPLLPAISLLPWISTNLWRDDKEAGAYRLDRLAIGTP